MMGLLLPSVLLIVAAPEAATAADAITLRDGAVVLGQVVEDAPRGRLALIVRRAWVREALPERAKAWEAIEAPLLERARKARRARLEDWKHERAEGPAGDDVAIGPWLEAEIDRLKDPAGADLSPLMMVSLNRREVRHVVRRPRWTTRLLRLGWQAGFRDVETMTLKDLRLALEGRGFSPQNTGPVSVDDLLPPTIEPEGRWRLRRAATEVSNEPGLWFIRSHGLVLPEGGADAPGVAASALSNLVKSLAGEVQADPMEPRSREVAARGRIGLVLTSLDMAEDFSSVKVESTLFVRTGPHRWEPAVSRPAIVRPDDLRPDAGDGLAADPQVNAVFNLVESLGLGDIPAEMKRRTLNVGAATQRAIGLAKEAFRQDLDALALTLERGGAPRPGPDR